MFNSVKWPINLFSIFPLINIIKFSWIFSDVAYTIKIISVPLAVALIYQTWWDTFFYRQSLDSSGDVTCLKERIQKSQEEREKQTLQQTGNTTETFPLTLRALVKSHSVKPERLPLLT